MIVVADASPLNYLIQISCESVLGRRYDLVLVPSGVFEELHHPSVPPSVLSWVSEPPDWMRVYLVKAQVDPSLSIRDPGEREAIQLVEEQKAELLLIDEQRGRLEANAVASPSLERSVCCWPPGGEGLLMRRPLFTL